MQRSWWLISGIACWLVLSTPFSLTASAQEPGIRFHGTQELLLGAESTGQLTVVNDTDQELSVSVRVVDATGTGVTTPASTPVAPRIAPRGIGAVDVVTRGAAPGTSGYVIVDALPADGAGPLIARQAFTITSASLAVEPLVAMWALTDYRYALTSTAPEAIPVRPGGTCVTGQRDIVVGGVSGTEGGGSPVKATCAPDGVHLTFPTLSDTGSYTGSIDLLPDRPEKGLVELTVLRTDDVGWPLLAIAVGVVLAVLASRQTGRVNRLSERDQEALMLLAESRDAAREFRRLAHGTTWVGYTFESDLAELMSGVRRRLRRLRYAVSTLDDANPDYVDAGAAVAESRALIAQWPQLAHQMARLDTELAVVAVADVTEPAFLPGAQELLRGGPLTVADARDLVEGTRLALDLTTVWQGDRRALDGLERTVDALSFDLPSTEPGRSMAEQLDTARQLISRARAGLADAAGSAEYVARGVSADVAAVRSIVDRFRDRLPSAAGAVRDEVGRPPAGGPTGGGDFAEQAQRQERRRRVANTIVAAGIATVVLWSGLATLYFGKPVGSLVDYGTMLLWGFGAQAGLTTLAVAFDAALGRQAVAR